MKQAKRPRKVTQRPDEPKPAAREVRKQLLEMILKNEEIRRSKPR